jgi:hypothetical protein
LQWSIDKKQQFFCRCTIRHLFGGDNPEKINLTMRMRKYNNGLVKQQACQSMRCSRPTKETFEQKRSKAVSVA